MDDSEILTGRVVAIEKPEFKDTVLLSIIDDFQDNEMHNVDFPFVGTNLNLIPLQLALLYNRVSYFRLISDTPFNYKKYELELLDGPLKGQVYTEYVYLSNK